MMSTGPMTIIAVLVILTSFAVGVGIIIRARSAQASMRSKVCPECREKNPGHADYCAHCGQRLATR